MLKTPFRGRFELVSMKIVPGIRGLEVLAEYEAVAEGNDSWAPDTPFGHKPNGRIELSIRDPGLIAQLSIGEDVTFGIAPIPDGA